MPEHDVIPVDAGNAGLTATVSPRARGAGRARASRPRTACGQTVAVGEPLVRNAAGESPHRR